MVHQLITETVEVLPITAAKIRHTTCRDPVLSRVQQLVLYGWPPQLPQEDKSYQPFFNRRDELKVTQGIIYWGLRVIIPQSLQQQILIQLHDSILAWSK